MYAENLIKNLPHPKLHRIQQLTYSQLHIAYNRSLGTGPLETMHLHASLLHCKHHSIQATTNNNNNRSKFVIS